jgi:rsbT co-antagonist protein RsbR
VTAVAEPSEADRARWLGDLLEHRRDAVLAAWADARGGAPLSVAGSFGPADADRSEELLDALRQGLLDGGTDVDAPAFDGLRRMLADLSVHGARAGASPQQTGTGVLALAEGLVAVAVADPAPQVDPLTAVQTITRLVNALALHTVATYLSGREEVIGRQSAQLLELSTPVVRLWDGVVGAPLVGTLDSARAQVVMESLLQAIVDEHASVAILDITGVPTVDTLVAQHLLKTVTATRLMGADCIISGIRPSTAQTIVQLGIDLADITTRATLADALSTAIERVAAAAPAPASPRA